MNAFRISALAALVALSTEAASNHPAYAGSATSNMALSAVVVPTCSISAGPLSFGTYSGAQLDAIGDIVVLCSIGTVPSVGLGNGGNFVVGARHLGSNAVSLLTYELYSDGNRSTVWNVPISVSTLPGLPQHLTVFGRIFASQVVFPGAYADTVVATITF